MTAIEPQSDPDPQPEPEKAAVAFEPVEASLHFLVTDLFTVHAFRQVADTLSRPDPSDSDAAFARTFGPSHLSGKGEVWRNSLWPAVEGAEKRYGPPLPMEVVVYRTTVHERQSLWERWQKEFRPKYLAKYGVTDESQLMHFGRHSHPGIPTASLTYIEADSEISLKECVSLTLALPAPMWDRLCAEIEQSRCQRIFCEVDFDSLMFPAGSKPSGGTYQTFFIPVGSFVSANGWVEELSWSTRPHTPEKDELAEKPTTAEQVSEIMQLRDALQQEGTALRSVISSYAWWIIVAIGVLAAVIYGNHKSS